MYDSIGMEICDDRESYEAGYYAGFKAREAEPIEITEEEIIDILLTHFNVSPPEVMAKAILSKLRCE